MGLVEYGFIPRQLQVPTTSKKALLELELQQLAEIVFPGSQLLLKFLKSAEERHKSYDMLLFLFLLSNGALHGTVNQL